MDIVEVFLAEKEARDRQTSIELRAKGVITTPGVRSPSLVGKKSMDCSPEACLN